MFALRFEPDFRGRPCVAIAINECKRDEMIGDEYTFSRPAFGISAGSADGVLKGKPIMGKPKLKKRK